MGCSCNKHKISGTMARRKRISKNSVENVLMTAGAGIVGFVAAKMLNKIDFVKQSPYIAGAVKIGAGVVTATMLKQKMATGVGVGMATAGLQEIVGNFITTVEPDPLPTFAGGLGIGYPQHIPVGRTEFANQFPIQVKSV